MFVCVCVYTYDLLDEITMKNLKHSQEQMKQDNLSPIHGCNINATIVKAPKN